MAYTRDGSGKLRALFLGMKQPPLVKHLRRILSEYPDGGQIIKELIQNAEDASAHVMKVLYDKREINRDIGETTPKYTKFFQCPALAVFNDAEFTESDWEGIRMIECSVKEVDRLKVGRFGLGFKSVFHMTDYPCVISGRYILLMDPQQPGDMVTAMMEIRNLQDYDGIDIQAFLKAIDGTFGFSEEVISAGDFPGTLFWFPLRQCIYRTQTLLSDNLYTEDKVMNLFEEFEQEANSILLFMKTLESMALYIKGIDCVCKELIKVEISDSDSVVRKTREKFKEDIDQISDDNADEALYSTACLTIQTTVKSVSHETNWIVVNYFVCRSASETFTKLMHDKSFGYSPLVGVAAQLGNSSVPAKGKIFCCLPLPNDSANVTGLPLHVNGFFALSQNRHHLKWFTEEQMGKETDDKNLLWNQLMLSEALPKAYELIVDEIIKYSVQSGNREDVVSSLYMALPNSNQTLDKWKSVEERLYDLIEGKTILYCSHLQKWISVKEALFATFEDVPKCLETAKETVTKCLIMMKQNYVNIPLTLINTIRLRFDDFKDISAYSFCQMLRRDDVYKDMSTTEKMLVLEYLLRDSATMLSLEGLLLLPLASGAWTCFQTNTDTPVYICSDEEMILYPGQEEKFLPKEADLGKSLSEQFSSLAEKGFYQMKRICVESRKALLYNTLAKHYNSSSTKFIVRWLQAVWDRLLQLQILDNFTDMPLVPIVTHGISLNPKAFKLCKLSDIILLKTHKGEMLSDNLCSSLQAMAVTVVSHLPRWIPDSVIKEYILLPNQACVVTLLNKIGKSENLQATVSNFNQTSSDSSKNALLKYMTNCLNIAPEAKEFLKMLRIFNVAKSQQDPGEYVDLTNKSLKYMLSGEMENFHDTILFPFPILTTKRGEEKLLIQLGVKQIRLQSLILQTINNMNKKQNIIENQNFMNYFIKQFVLFDRCPEVVNSASRLLFLRAGKEYHRASNLFDPTDPILKAALMEENRVPESNILFTDEYIRVLKCLGLKAKKDLTADILLSVAERLHQWTLDGNMTKEMFRKADAFLEILDTNSNVLSKVCQGGQKLSDCIRNLLCVSYKRSATGTSYPACLPWYSQSYLLCRPSETTEKTHCNLVGGTMPVVEMSLSMISKTFGWVEDPPLSKLFEQINVLQQVYTDDKKPDILHVLKDIYYHLNSRCNKDILHQHYNEQINGKIVWTGDGFELPSRMVIETKSDDLDIRPYFYNIPVEFKSIRQFFRNIGCLEKQDHFVLLNTLETVRDKHDAISFDEAETERDREFVIKVLTKLANMKEQYNVNLNEKVILMPIQETNSSKLILLPVSECTYDDDPEYSDDNEENVYLVHAHVSLNIARSLGVKSIRRRALIGAEELGLENWSQEEKLTARIHTLLRDGYNDGFSVPKELIQNADDAHASVVKFLYDERTNSDAQTRLLSKGMAECQGPALWVFNNAKFTTNDLFNIIKLNGSTKQNDARRIGKFGLGFCSVYNVTDVPSFVSGTDLVIFDPHGYHLKDAEIGTKDLKGLKISLLQRSLIKRHIDQFRPFHGIFGCNLLDPNFKEFNSTLFRLPLRTRTQSLQSEILQKEYSNDEMIKLLDLLVKSAGNLLLFSQHVHRIELYHLKNLSTASELSLMFTIEKESHEWRNGVFSPLYKSVLDIVQDDTILEQLYKLVVKQEIYEGATSLINSLKELPYVDTSSWLVSWTTGRAESWQLAQSLNKEDKKTFSLAAVAVPCKKENPWFLTDLKEVNYGFYKEGHVFCFLPLPVKTRLCFHMNGCFQVTSNRKNLYALTEDDKGDQTNQWNEALIKDTLVRSLLLMLVAVSRNTSSHVGQEPYYALWPVDCTEQVLSLKKSFFRKIVVENAPVFSSCRTWVSFQDIVFLNPSLRQDYIGEIAFDVLQTLPPRQGKMLIEMPENVLAALRHSNQDLLQQINDILINEEEFCITFLKNIKDIFWNTKQEMRNKIIIFCLMRNTKVINEMMKKTECIPTEPNHVLRRPNYLVHPTSVLSSLFKVTDGRFPADLHDFTFGSAEVLKMLSLLGMNERNISAELLIDRCESIALIAEKCCNCARERCIAVNEYLAINISRLQKNTIENIRDIFIMPVLERPKEWEFSWNADKCSTIKLFENIHDCSIHTVPSKSIMLGKPRYLFRHNAQDYVAMTENIVDENMIMHVVSISCLQNLLDYFGVKGHDEVTLDNMIKQIMILVEEFNEQENNFEETKRIHDKIFNRLEKLVTTGELQQHKTYANINMLSSHSVVFIGSKFVKPECVVFSLMEECRPYMYQLPESDQKYRRYIYEKLGVKRHFSIQYILTVMNVLQTQSNFGHCLQYEAFKPLLENLMHSMKKENKTYADLESYHENILAPDSNCTLYPTCELIIDNDDYETSSSMKIIHPIISSFTAAFVGVNSKKNKCFQDMSIGISFGQHEDLTIRIHNLLKAYPCDDSIMKELLQNADDAGATEICFIKDYRTHPARPNKIFGSEKLQGPALCVYNNSVFTEEDINGLHNLGQGSKGDDPTKTGQYGVGFNAVYHLTDTPSFLTKGPGFCEGGILCILDPLCKHVPLATKSEPGQICQLDKVKHNFPDVLLGYSEDLLLKTGVGTIFRFPFRSTQSNISENVIDPQNMDSLISKFKTHMSESLLFLKHVRRISVWNITSGSIVSEYSLSSQLSDESKVEVDTFHNRVRNILKVNKSTKHFNLKAEVSEVVYELEIKDNFNYSSNWIVAQRFGFRQKMPYIDTLTNCFENKLLGQSPVGGVALPLQIEREGAKLHPMKTNIDRLSANNWLAFMTQKLAPTASLQSNGQCTSFKEGTMFGKAFCFLPLPINTGLPVHVNGHFALDHEARRELWMDGYQRLWNDSLLSGVIVPAWISTILHLQKYITEKMKNEQLSLANSLLLYHKFFPVLESATNEIWQAAMKAFYHDVSEQKITIFPVIIGDTKDKIVGNEINVASSSIQQLAWISVSCPSHVGKDKGVFNSVHVRSNIHSDFTNDSNTIVHILKMLGMQIIESPLTIADNMQKSGLQDIPRATPAYVLKYLGSYGMETVESCQIGKINVPIHETYFKSENNLRIIIKYIQRDTSYYLQLEGLPLLLTADMKLRQFKSNNPIYISKYWHLCSNFSEQFLHGNVIEMFNYAINKEHFRETLGKFFKPFNWTDFMQILPDLFDSAAAINSNQRIPWTKDSEKPISMKWLCCLYDFMHETAIVNDGSNYDINTDEIRQRFYQLQHWSFLPCTVIKSSNTSNVLIPCSEIVHLLHISKGDKLYSTLRKLNLPHLYMEAFTMCEKRLQVTGMVSKCVASSKRPHDLLKCLVNHKEQFCCNTTFNTQDALQLLIFFASELGISPASFNSSHDAKQMICSLPIFETIYGTLTSIDNINDVLLVPEDILRDGIEELALECRIVLLKHQEILQLLYNYIGVSASSVLSLYRTHILPNIYHLNPACWMMHITYIRDLITNYIQMSDDEKHIINILKGIAFVNINGTMKRVEELFSPDHSVFECFLDSSYFPPLHLRDATWKRFFKQLGLIMQPNGIHLLNFANEIALESRTFMTKSVLERSEILSQYIAKIESQAGWDKDTMNQLKGIRFVQRRTVPDEIVTIFSQFESEYSLICFDQAVSSKHKMICWTSVPLLPRKIVDQLESRDIAKTLGVLETPPVERVILHCQNVCDAMAAKISTVPKEFITNLMKLLYEFLTMHLMNDNKIIERLQHTPIIYLQTEHKLVMASQIITEMNTQCEIKPYLYKAPVYYGMFFNLFLCLGAATSASIDHYCTVLQRIKAESKDEPLHVNELRIVQHAIRNIVEILVTDKPSMGMSKSLFLPNKNKVLVNACDLVLCNNYSLEKRLRGNIDLDYFIGFDELELNIQDPNHIINALPKTMQPELLTSVVSEDIYMNEMTVNEFGRNAIYIQRLLHSMEFIHSVCRIVKDQFTSNRKVFNKETVSMINANISQIQIVNVDGLKTILKYKNQSLHGTQKPKRCYTEMTEHGYMFYYDCTSDREQINPYLVSSTDGLVSLIDKSIGNILNKASISIISSLLVDGNSHMSFSEQLDELGISTFDELQPTHLSAFPPPGTYVEKHYFPFLEQSIEPFKEEEFHSVAMELEDSTIDDDFNTRDPVYIYVHIYKEHVKTGVLSFLAKEYFVDTGDLENPVVKVAINRLYRFVRRVPLSGSELVKYDDQPISDLPVDENCRRIKSMLEEAWKMPEADKRRVMKRLQMKWYPDRNRGHETYSSQVFCYINYVIECLETNAHVSTDINSQTVTSSESVYNSMTIKIVRQAEIYAQAYYNNLADYQRPQNRLFRHIPDCRKPFKDYGEAGRWILQAKYDYKTALDMQHNAMDSHGYNWVCYLCHQACEKALKAAWFVKDANEAPKNSHSLSEISRRLDHRLVVQAQSMENLLQINGRMGCYTSMRYPDAASRPHIPADLYNIDQAQQALEITKQLIDGVTEYMDAA